MQFIEYFTEGGCMSLGDTDGCFVDKESTKTIFPNCQ